MRQLPLLELSKPPTLISILDARRHHGTFRLPCVRTFRWQGVGGVLRQGFPGREESYLLGTQPKWEGEAYSNAG